MSASKQVIVSGGFDDLKSRDLRFLEEAAKVTILDRIGAGDAMIAGVLDGILSGDFAKGIRQGAVTAALALSQYGDLVVTNRAELDQLVGALPTADICR